MGTLGAVEFHGIHIGARGGCVCSWIADFGCFAVFACVGGVDGVQEEGGRCCKEDVSARWVSAGV